MHSLTTINYTTLSDMSVLQTWVHIFIQFTVCDFALYIGIGIQWIIFSLCFINHSAH